MKPKYKVVCNTAAGGGVIPKDINDEEWLSCIKPAKLGVGNCFNGDSLIAHSSFYRQRELLDRSSILEQYGAWLHAEWRCDAKMREIDRTVQQGMVEVEIVTRDMRLVERFFAPIRNVLRNN